MNEALYVYKLDTCSTFMKYTILKQKELLKATTPSKGAEIIS